MFEFHGWIAIVEESSDDLDTAILDTRRETLCDTIEEMITALSGTNRVFHLHRHLNGSAHLVFCGFHNHRDKQIIDFFHKVAAAQPYSYGKLHIRDDEDDRGFQNTVQSWTMARANVIEATDVQLSPCIPTIEPEYKTTE
ncbi:MAG: Imm7 family immunity protein [Verrucomicrobiota bacterium]